MEQYLKLLVLNLRRVLVVTTFNLDIYSSLFWVNDLPRLGTERKTCFIGTRLWSPIILSNAQPSYSFVLENHFRIESSVIAARIPVTTYSRMSPQEALVPDFSRADFGKLRRSLIFIPMSTTASHNVCIRVSS